MNTSKRTTRILVIGGGGFYGRYLVNDLYKQTNANITIVGRKPLLIEPAKADRIEFVRCNISNLNDLEELVKGFDVVVHCAGPFQDLPLNPLLVAIQAKVNYVDISEDRGFHREVEKLNDEIRSSGITVLSGLSVAPAMEVIFAELMQSCFERLVSVRSFAAPDTRKHRGRAMFFTMLMGVGRSFWQPKDGNLRKVEGWTEPEWVEFPPPLGRRLTFLVLEMADLDLLPELFDVKTVEFKAGTEWAFLNRLLNMAAEFRKQTGYPNWESFTPVVRVLSWLMGRFGRDEGGVIFEITGVLNNSLVTHQVAVVARRDGGLIPAVLASIGVKKLVSGDIPTKGIVPLNKWISSDKLVKDLVDRDLEIWWKPHGAQQWRRFDFTDFQSYVVQ